MDPRRILLVLVFGCLAGYAWFRYDKRATDKFTPAEASKISLDDVKILAALDAERVKLIKSVVPSVVSITSSGAVLKAAPMTQMDAILGRRRAGWTKSTSLGSGVIVSKEGHILTNHHVVANATEFQVQLTDGRSIPARLIGSDPATDIAVLRVEDQNIDPLPFGNSDDLRAGQEVYAVGNPYGFEETVSRGIVSSNGRRVLSDDGVDFIQHDAAVNQGNSGGPLLNLRGEIVGINSRIFSQTGGWQGISFAIPAKTARKVMEDILTSGRYARRYFGAEKQSMNRVLARDLRAPDASGAVLTQVIPTSPAAQAGLQRGDIVRRFDGKDIGDAEELDRAITDTKVGRPVEIEFLRFGTPGRTKATLTDIAPAVERRE